MVRLTVLVLLVTMALTSCEKSSPQLKENMEQKDFAQWVNPLIGTSKMGHVFPGATTPFGMVQLSPQTNFQTMFNGEGQYNKSTYEYCAGYQYKDTTILGFAHTNFSGTGHSDLGDVLIMPGSGKAQLEESLQFDSLPSFASTFSHANEKAEPGFYSVHLDKDGIVAELTTSDRVGYHRYRFEKEEAAHFILDMVYNVYHYEDKNVWTSLRVENDSLITGYRQTKGWARDRKVFFAIRTSKQIQNYGFKRYDKANYNGFYRNFNEFQNFPEMAGKNIRAYFDFELEGNNTLELKVALSSVSTANALLNLDTEIEDWDFEKVKQESREKWNQELGKIEVDMMTEADATSFYTSMYHAALSPVVYQDVNGEYRGLDQNIHTATDFTNYTIFSLWDTYRALHPLYNVIQQKRNNDMIKSMLAHQAQSVHGMLPIWSHYANENWCMIGYHATSVIADAAIKGVGDFDKAKALDACVNTAQVPYFGGLSYYMDLGYVPEDKSSSSVSKTLEYAYNDWCIAQLARQQGDAETEANFEQRATAYLNVYDEQIGFMRPKLSNGNFREEFDPMDTHGQGYIEGNAWNYGLYVPQNIPNMIEIMGGKSKFVQRLDSIFEMEIDDKYIEHNEDITREGIMGNYVHGNEPSHHIPYLYNWTNAPEKTQLRVRAILREMYKAEIDGLCGNDDAGQMSAWYIFSAIGFYPVTPGSNIYALGSPLVKNATVHLENGKQIVIKAENQAEENVYVEKVMWNGIELTEPFITHEQLMEGGELVFTMKK